MRNVRPRFAWAAAAVMLLLVGPMFYVVVTPEHPADRLQGVDGDGAASAHEAASAWTRAGDEPLRDLGQILGALPEPLSSAAALGPASDILFDETGDLRASPSDVDDIFALVRKEIPWEPAPVPVPPEGPEPLLAALGTYTETLGLDLPDLDLLRGQITLLRLQPEAEQALSQLVLAYTEAVQLEAEAVAALDAESLALLAHAPSAVTAWYAEDEDRTPADLEAHMQDLLLEVDMAKRLRAADLLMRTTEQVKDLVALPPAPLLDADVAVIPEELVADPAALTGAPDADWDKIHALIVRGRIDNTEFPGIPREDLSQALRHLAWTLGHPTPADLEFPGVEVLPASLADAVAQIVTARYLGLLSGDANLHAFLLLEAMRSAEPTLQAWAALSELPPVALPDVHGILKATLQGAASPSTLLAAGLGLPAGDDLAAPPRLDILLQQEGMSAEEARQVVAALPVPLELGIAYALDGLQSADAVRDRVFGPLTPGERAAIERTGEVMALREAPSWTHADAALMATWTEAMAKIGPEGLLALQRSQVDVVAAVEAAGAVLGPYAATGGDVMLPVIDEPVLEPSKAPWYKRAWSALTSIQIIPSVSAQMPPSPVEAPCPEAAALTSDCRPGRDVWFRFAGSSQSILITGFGTTRLTTAVVSETPTLLIDLGGDDEYLLPVGASGSAGARVAIDLGGNDLYDAQSTLAHGAADGLGALGILWDSNGADTYIHTCKSSPCGAQGYGANGGLGLLLDGAGADTYRAPDSRAHGTAWGTGSVGMLLDLGAGKDTLQAGRGQGYAQGHGSLGFLLNDGFGANSYATVFGNPRYQGGHNPGDAATGMLIDLGGKGTTYSNLLLPADVTYLPSGTEEPVRAGDALWVERGLGLGLGLDSTLEDDDHDNYPNLVELLAGSDPQDDDSKPEDSLDVVTLIEILQSLAGDMPDPPDANDPLGSLQGTVFSDRLFCYAPFEEDRSCPIPMSLLYIGGSGDDTIDETAHILVELGGSDVYKQEVAGQGAFYIRELDGQRNEGVGSIAYDLGGDDTYEDPGVPSQGAVKVFKPEDDVSFTNTPPYTEYVTEPFVYAVTEGALLNALLSDNQGEQLQIFIDEMGKRVTDVPPPPYLGNAYLSPVSLLLDSAGDDLYEASEMSQASTSGPGCFDVQGSVASKLQSPPGAAWLVDRTGNDRYTAGTGSQAATLSGSGSAGLIDLSGDDHYRFSEQAAVNVVGFGICGSSHALLYDGAGRDTYHSDTFQVEVDALVLDDPGATANEVAFTTQGRGSGNQVGVFFDDGGEFDTYLTLNTTLGTSDVSHVKNEQTRSKSDLRGFFFDGATWFASLGDEDGDGAGAFLEYLAGTNPRIADDDPGTLWSEGGDGVEGEDPWLRILDRPIDQIGLVLPGLMIGGRGDSLYGESFGFMVSLGGNNTYTGPFLGGAGYDGAVKVNNFQLTRRPVTLLLDAGDGDTHYQPRSSSCSSGDIARSFICPTLGGAINAIAIVADGGGNNTFYTEASVNVSAGDGPERIFNLVTQGAAANNGVGALVTWNATRNDFTADFTAQVDDPGFNIRGVAQGASLGGIGLLATTGQSNDTYTVRLESAGDDVPMFMGMAQGAAIQLQRELALGLLMDGGGTNHYTAPQGFSQGFASTPSPVDPGSPLDLPFAFARSKHKPSMGWGFLWSGTGDDTFTGHRFSQGAALGHPHVAFRHRNTGGNDIVELQGEETATVPVGLLYDAGGHDVYRILPVDDGRGISQGAGLYGLGILVDAAGDDLYESLAANHVQGAGIEGAGLLLDLGGSDRYIAPARSQGHGSDFHSLVLGQAASTDPDGFSKNATGRTPGEASTDAAEDGQTVADWVAGDPPADEDVEAFVDGVQENATSGYLKTVLGWMFPLIPTEENAVDSVTWSLCYTTHFSDHYMTELSKNPGSQQLVPPLTPQNCALGDGISWIDSNYIVVLRAELEEFSDRLPQDVDGGIHVEVEKLRQLSLQPLQRPTLGMIVDLHGRDRYQIIEQGHGFASSIGCGSYYALFLDASGTDVYTGDTNANDDFDWTQSGETQCPETTAIGFGRDSEGISQETLRTLYSPVLGDVELQVETEDGVVAGDVLLVAALPVQPCSHERVERVTFTANNVVVGHGQPLPPVDNCNVLQYEFVWNTTAGGMDPVFPDGEYELHASVYLASTGGGGYASAPDLPAKESEPETVVVDNPPVIEVSMTGTIASPASPIPLTLHVKQDAQWPSEPPACSPKCKPGALIEITRQGSDGIPHLFYQQYRNASTHVVDLPSTDGDPWPDGEYSLRVNVTDTAAKTVVLDHLPNVTIDSVPPTSSIITPPYTGGSSGTIQVAWGHDDGAEGSGTETVCVFRIDDTGDVMTGWPQCHPTSRQTHVLVPGLVTNSVVHFITVAVDVAGNTESPCHGTGTSPTCLPEKLKNNDGTVAWGNVTTIVADFDMPQITNVRVNGMDPGDVYLQPGQYVNFTADAADIGAGLDRVEIHLPDHDPAAPTFLVPGLRQEVMKTDGQGHYWYDEWHLHNADLHAEHFREVATGFTVVALDQANNRVPETATITIDSLPPAVLEQQTRYVAEGPEGQERVLMAGRPGIFADVRAHVKDIAIQSVTIDVQNLTKKEADIKSCEEGGDAIWTCRFLLPEVEDGDYVVPLQAVDAAGNQNVTQKALVMIRSQPLDLEGIVLSSIGHDGFQVVWSTSFDGTSRIEYGRTSQLGQATQAGTGHRMHHIVDIGGLAPATKYYFRVVSENTAGIPSQSSLYNITTLNAYSFNLTGITTDDVLRDVVEIGHDITFHSGNAPVTIDLALQDAGGVASPYDIDSFQFGQGAGNISLDTRAFADGDYRLIYGLDRAGDAFRFLSPIFSIDNTEPVIVPILPRASSTINDTAPEFEAMVMDPLGRGPPAMETFQVRLGNTTLNHTVVTSEAVDGSSTQRRIVFTLDDLELGQGLHDFSVLVADEAGNLGSASWPVRVDHEPPRLVDVPETTPLPGPDASRPGGQLQVVLHLEDESGVASVSLNLSAMMPGASMEPVSLLAGKNSRWEVTASISATARDGTFQAPISAVDMLGNTGIVGALNVTVDARPPQIQNMSAQEVKYTTARITFTTDEPTRTWWGNGVGPSATDWNTSHGFDVTGLVPGQAHAISLHAVDRAGNPTNGTFVVSTLVDDEDPTAVAQLAGVSPSEGVVVLSWMPATDNAGIDHYRLTRSAAERADAMAIDLPANATTFRDSEAPAGRSVSYTITAVDVADRSGEAAKKDIDVLARPHLLGASITPLRGASEDPFTFQVEYRHAGGRVADSVTVRLGEAIHPLDLVEESGACHLGCVYRKELRLPPSSLFSEVKEAVFEASTGDEKTTLATPDIPFVLRGDGWANDQKAGKGVPGAGLFPIMVALAFALISIRRRNHP